MRLPAFHCKTHEHTHIYTPHALRSAASIWAPGGTVSCSRSRRSTVRYGRAPSQRSVARSRLSPNRVCLRCGGGSHARSQPAAQGGLAVRTCWARPGHAPEPPSCAALPAPPARVACRRLRLSGEVGRARERVQHSARADAWGAAGRPPPEPAGLPRRARRGAVQDPRGAAQTGRRRTSAPAGRPPVAGGTGRQPCSGSRHCGRGAAAPRTPRPPSCAGAQEPGPHRAGLRGWGGGGHGGQTLAGGIHTDSQSSRCVSSSVCMARDVSKKGAATR